MEEGTSENSPLLPEMDASKIGRSTDELVANNKGKRFLQYVAAILANLGAFSFGTSLGWTSPLSGRNDTYIHEILNNEEDTKEIWSWIGALMPLGAASVALVAGALIDKFGRKITMLSLVIPFTVGWSLIIWPKELYMIYAGRFLLGMAGGSIAVAAPVYTSEIAEKEIRGALGSYFQLMITLGILFVYVLGRIVEPFFLSLICGIVPLVFGITFFFVPESPLYLLSKNDLKGARKSLQFFRGQGQDFNIEHEMNEIQETIRRTNMEKLTVFQSFSTKAAKKALFIGLALMLFQQFSGVNAVIFYTDDIFKAAKSELDTSSIIVGAVQFIATLLSTLLVDRLGRKFLLLASSSLMCICTLLLGVFFFLDDRGNNVDSIGWLPLASLCLFIVAFSIGYGPIPWMMTGELFTSSIKGLASSILSFTNFLLAFLVTKFYAPLNVLVGAAITFWIFSGFLLLSTAFVFLVLKETKGKTSDEIQVMLGS